MGALNYILTSDIPHHSKTLCIANTVNSQKRIWDIEDDYIPHVDQSDELWGHCQKQLLRAKVLAEGVDVLYCTTPTAVLRKQLQLSLLQ